MSLLEVESRKLNPGGFTVRMLEFLNAVDHLCYLYHYEIYPNTKQPENDSPHPTLLVMSMEGDPGDNAAIYRIDGDGDFNFGDWIADYYHHPNEIYNKGFTISELSLFDLNLELKETQRKLKDIEEEIVRRESEVNSEVWKIKSIDNSENHLK